MYHPLVLYLTQPNAVGSQYGPLMAVENGTRNLRKIGIPNAYFTKLNTIQIIVHVDEQRDSSKSEKGQHTSFRFHDQVNVFNNPMRANIGLKHHLKYFCISRQLWRCFPSPFTRYLHFTTFVIERNSLKFNRDQDQLPITWVFLRIVLRADARRPMR